MSHYMSLVTHYYLKFIDYEILKVCISFLHPTFTVSLRILGIVFVLSIKKSENPIWAKYLLKILRHELKK